MISPESLWQGPGYAPDICYTWRFLRDISDVAMRFVNRWEKHLQRRYFKQNDPRKKSLRQFI